MTLSKLERYFLSNQLRILEKLYPAEADELGVQREAIEQGYTLVYEMGMDHILDGDDAITTEEAREVWDTMNMFLSIDDSIKELDLEDQHSKNPERFFSGYDGNNETKFMSFATFTVERLGRFKHLPLKEKFHYNSHSPRRDTYRKMLSVWHKIDYSKRFPMSQDDLESVLGACTDIENQQ